MSDLDPMDVMGDPTAQEQARAYAAALRRQQFVGSMGSLLGNRGMADFGRQVAGAAEQQAAEVSPHAQTQLALQQQALRKGQEELAAQSQRRSALADPTSLASLARVGLARRFGIQAPEGTPGAAIDDKELGLGEHAQIADENRKARLEMQRNGGAAREDARQQRQEQKDAAREDKLATGLGADLDPYKQRGGLSGYTSAINRAAKIDKLIVDPKSGQLRQVIDKRMMAELAMALQGLVSAGHASQTEVEHLIPHSSSGKLADALEYFTNKPWDAGQQAFAAQMLHSAHIEAETNRAQLMDALRTRIPTNYGPFHKLNPSRAESILRSHELNPAAFDENGLMKDGAQFILPDAKTAKRLEHFKAQLKPGERLAVDDEGNAKALDPGQALPDGFKEIF